jgi:hypothetical protein
MTVHRNIIGLAALVASQVSPFSVSAALASPSLSSTSSVSAGDSATVIGTPTNSAGFSSSAAYGVDLAPFGAAGASASSDINYNTRAYSSVNGTGIGSSAAQWFETITNNTADRRRYSFSFSIDAGALDVTGNDAIITGQGTAGFEIGFNITSTGGNARQIFAVKRSVGATTTAGAETYSQTATNFYDNVVGGGRLQDSAVTATNNVTAQSWSTSFFTIDLGELASGESFSLAYLLRSFSNSQSDIDCAPGGITAGTSKVGATPPVDPPADPAASNRCLISNARVGDPATVLSALAPLVGLSSTAVAAVPEPATAAILGLGMIGLLFGRRRA